MASNRTEDLLDTALQEEIELLGRVLETAAQVDHPLHEPELDRALGVDGADVTAERS